MLPSSVRRTRHRTEVSMAWVLAVCLFLLSTLPAQAVTRLLSPTGSDSGDCTSLPCKTIQYVNSQIPSGGGDTVQFADGTYTDANDYNIPIKSNTTWRATNLHGATIKTGSPNREG